MLMKLVKGKHLVSIANHPMVKGVSGSEAASFLLLPKIL